MKPCGFMPLTTKVFRSPHGLAENKQVFQTPSVLLQQLMAPVNFAYLKSVHESISQEKSVWHIIREEEWIYLFYLSCALEICSTLGGEWLPTTVM